MENRKLQLQPRLQMLADLVPAGAKLADVGTDHGYLPVWLLQEGRIRQAIASDINLEPLEHARRTAAEYGVSERMEFRLCAGLDKIRPDETDTIVIAGMGGETILSILESAPWSKKSGAFLRLGPNQTTPGPPPPLLSRSARSNFPRQQPIPYRWRRHTGATS